MLNISYPGRARRQQPLPSLTCGALLLATLGPALVLGGNRFGLIVPSGVLVLLVLTVQAPYQRYPKYASWLFLAVIGWGAVQISLSLTPDRGEAARILSRYMLYAAVYLGAVSLSLRDRQAWIAIRAVSLWIAAISAYGLVAWTVGHNPLLAELEAYSDALEATFINRNAFALYAVFGLFASLGAWVSGQGGARGIVDGGWIWLSAAAICCVALILTGSRGGAGAGVVGLIILSGLLARGYWATGISGAALIGSFLLSAGFLRQTSDFEDVRFTVHQTVLARVLDAPFLGHGLGSFQDSFRATPGVEWRWGDWDHAHQQYLETAYELGWPAAIALFAAILLAAPKPVRGQPLTAVALASLAAAATHAFVDFSLTIPAVTLTLALLLGVARGDQMRVS